MKDFPSCFGESGVQVADSSSSSTNKAAHNLVTCVYQCELEGLSHFIIITWAKNLMGQILSISIEDSTNQCLCKVEIKPWLFSKRRGLKSLVMESSIIDIYWDLSSAKFGSGPEPLEGFYLAVMYNQELVLLLGDLEKEVYKKTGAEPFESNAVFVAKKGHVFGKKQYHAKSQLCDKGKVHDIAIECDTSGTNDPCLVIRIDGKTVLQVKHLRWKFRGNYTVLIDGLPVDVYWDVHSWLFGNVMGNAVFLFRIYRAPEASCMGESVTRSPPMSWTGSGKVTDYKPWIQGFSLLLYAWKNE